MKQLCPVLSAGHHHIQTPQIADEVLHTYHNLYSVAFYNSMVVLEKETLKPFGITDNKANVGREL